MITIIAVPIDHPRTPGDSSHTYDAVDVVQAGALLQLHVRLVDAGSDGAHPVVVLAALVTLQGDRGRDEAAQDRRRQQTINAHPESTLVSEKV